MLFMLYEWSCFRAIIPSGIISVTLGLLAPFTLEILQTFLLSTTKPPSSQKFPPSDDPEFRSFPASVLEYTELLRCLLTL